MMRINSVILISFILLSCSKKETLYDESNLNNGWNLQSSSITNTSGSVISKPEYNTQAWYSCNIPSTVFTALINAGEYKDIYFSNNLQKVNTERFQTSWWYRKEFLLDCYGDAFNQTLILEGLNYRANIWLNGTLIAKADTVENPFRIFKISLNNNLLKAKNALAVEVFPPQPQDLTIGFVDWNPPAPDANMGLWRGVKIIRSGVVSLNDVYVRSDVDTTTLKSARISIGFNLKNFAASSKKIKITADFEGVRIEKEIEANANGCIEGVFDPDDFETLNLKDARLWWPNGMGKPELYTLNISASVDGLITDHKTIRFGIRTIGQYINRDGHRGYKINGKKVLIKGAGWVDDLTLSDTDEKVKVQVEYARHTNLNTIRLEGFWGNSEKFYDYADENGMLVMLGWSCHWEWEGYCGRPETDFMSINPNEFSLHTQSYADQVMWLRNHPSVFLWVYGSDKLPPTELEAMLNNAINKVDPTRPILASCKYYDADDIFNNTSKISGPTGVKMRGPYDYVTPNYWYVDTHYGGAYGFNTETGPGPQVPPLESLQRMLPADSLWPPTNSEWNYHCGRNEFHSIKRFLNAFNHRYGESSDIKDFAKMCQVSNYEAIRPMFEAFSANKFNSTGVVQWMLNSAWPEMYWQLYDWYLMPNGAFYGTRSACRPLNISYNYGSKTVFVSSDLIEPKNKLRAEVKVFNLESKLIFSNSSTIDIESNTSKEVLGLSELKDLTTAYFVDLRLYQEDSSLIATNFYWLSTQDDILDYKKTAWFVTPNSQFADLRGLRDLEKVKVESNAQFSVDGDKQRVTVTLKNSSEKIAFFLELAIKGSQAGKTILPVFWDDNYISLLPGELRTISAWVYTKNLEGQTPTFELDGINISK
ncbi:MAG: glycoside hydrolase family 2 [Bacteroidales bacterium]|nr:MAG: glycoside hydrolase family 2 [Bacteroidales bacterium]